MTLPRGAYQALADALGAEHICDDPAVTGAYSYMWLLYTTHAQSGRRLPAAVALPRTTEDIQTIIRIANRYRFSYIPVGTNFIPPTIPTRPDTIIIDPKRMNRVLELDEQNMYAVVQPYVTYAQLQAEAMKTGLTLNTPEAGSQVSVVANNLSFGLGGASHKFGFNRGVLGCDWVLPTGELLHIGSRGAAGGDWFWGDCAGLNLKGLLRADSGHMGGLGMVTAMAVKLFPYPGPGTFPVRGTNPDYSAEFPEDRFRLNLIRFPSKDIIADVMYAIGHAEIATGVHGEQAIMVLCGAAPSVEKFWERYPRFQQEFRNVLSVTLVGYSSARQLAYEQKVLDAIVEEFGGACINRESPLWEVGKNLLGEYTRCGLSNRLFRVSGDFFTMGGFTYDSIDHSFAMSREFSWPLIEQGIAQGHLVPDDTQNDWVSSAQMGHFSETEPLVYFEHDISAGGASMGGYVQTIAEALKRKLMPSWPIGAMNYMTGPHMCNYHELVLKIKKTLDPNSASNPGYPLPTAPPGQ